ncbi:MAG: hypothetical protein QOF60_2146 [Actinomycetota bacterium]|nr:hypothetical protein [Actinomycetota bacterium]
MGEEWTADVLESLGRGFSVLHDLVPPGRRWNIDHVVVGRCGVVVVETKRWRGSVRVGRRGIWLDGRRRDDVGSQVAMQVDVVSRAVGASVPVRSFVCIHGASVRRRWWARRRPVGGPEELVRWLRRLPAVLGRGQVDRTFAAFAGWER